MSQEGYDKLVAELHQLESVDLPQVRDAIAEARDKGDLREGKISIKSPIAQALLNKKWAMWWKFRCLLACRSYV